MFSSNFCSYFRTYFASNHEKRFWFQFSCGARVSELILSVQSSQHLADPTNSKFHALSSFENKQKQKHIGA